MQRAPPVCRCDSHSLSDEQSKHACPLCRQKERPVPVCTHVQRVSRVWSSHREASASKVLQMSTALVQIPPSILHVWVAGSAHHSPVLQQMPPQASCPAGHPAGSGETGSGLVVVGRFFFFLFFFLPAVFVTPSEPRVAPSSA